MNVWIADRKVFFPIGSRVLLPSIVVVASDGDAPSGGSFFYTFLWTDGFVSASVMRR